jgi:hypothetical protein
MVARDRFQGFGRKTQVHRMAWFGLKIDGQPAEHRVHGRDFPATPTPMNAIATRSQLDQRFDVLPVQLASRHHFLKLFFHKTSKNLAPN